MFIVVETLAKSSSIYPALLDHVREKGFRLAWVPRPLDLAVKERAPGEPEEDPEAPDTVPELEQPITAEEIAAGHERVRQWLYLNVTDPLFFKAQRGEATLEEWQNAVQEIKQEWAVEDGGGD